MTDNKKLVYAAIIALGVIISAVVLGNAFKNRNSNGTITTTGLGETNFVSDLIVWEGNFSESSYDLKEAYTNLEKTKDVIKRYLTKKGVADSSIIFAAVETINESRSDYTSDGRYIGQVFTGYRLSQNVKVESTDVANIEKIAREVTELLNDGVKFYSQPPRYYYTKLSDVKLDLISQATEDAKKRAEQIASKSGAKLGKVLEANMGIFQITGQNSNEDYSWGGTFNTADKNKTASITMKLTYKVD
ncbi:MAG: hypothetical protein RLZZ337_674 [Bacteroidota bacterium]|jgi:hypothetical protein